MPDSQPTPGCLADDGLWIAETRPCTCQTPLRVSIVSADPPRGLRPHVSVGARIPPRLIRSRTSMLSFIGAPRSRALVTPANRNWRAAAA